MSQDVSLDKVLKLLHPFERVVFPLLPKTKKFSELLKKSTLKDVEIMRALEWLENKKLITTEKMEQQVVTLGENGHTYLKKGLPERRILVALKDKSILLTDIQKNAELSTEEFNSALGTLRRLQAIIFTKEAKPLVALTDHGKAMIKKEINEERFIRKKFPILLNQLSVEDNLASENLRKRKDIIIIKEEKDRIITLTQLGQRLSEQKIDQKETIGRLTPSLLQTGSWKKKEFRPYDVTINVPSLYPGKKHMVTQAVEYIRRIWLELGFKEMSGRMIQTSFWDLDALFVPQDHPARDMQDTFYLAEPEKGDLPPLAEKIKSVHENGGKIGSTGWRSAWSEEEARKLLLRTHTTVLSAQTIAALKETDLPAKFFAVGKVFRNETLDYSHLFEFFQVEGIVVDPNANLKHLKGYLKEFYQKMGYPDVRIRPAHFPYTEPSCEVEVFHPIKKTWLELGGAGIFRPEVVIPLLGKDIPVLAWGLGLDRIISSYYKITDIRDLYKNDIKQLREAKLWVR